MKLPLTLSALALLPSLAHAAFVDFGSYSKDTATQLEWLDLTATAGYTYGEVRSGVGGFLADGWRVAIGAEVTDLFSRYVQTTPETYHLGLSYLRAEQLVYQLGVIMSFGNMVGGVHFNGESLPHQITAAGYFDDGNSNSLAGIAEITARLADSNGDISIFGSRWIVYPDWTDENLVLNGRYGTFLVREVPTPSSGALFLATIALASSRLRRPVGKAQQ